jgi:hypothetical protein
MLPRLAQDFDIINPEAFNAVQPLIDKIAERAEA